MPQVVKSCEGCGVAFESWPNHGRKFCSRRCSNVCGSAGRKIGDRVNRPRTFACVRCGDTFDRWPSQVASGHYKFCSRECSDLIRQNRRTFECLACGVEKTVKAGQPSKFCSTACAYGYERMTPEEAKAAQRRSNTRRRARIAALVSERFTTREIGERDKWRCGICSKKVNPDLAFPHRKSATVDHIVPISEGGHDVRANVQIAHFSCNCTKRNKALPGGEQLRLIG